MNDPLFQHRADWVLFLIAAPAGIIAAAAGTWALGSILGRW